MDIKVVLPDQASYEATARLLEQHGVAWGATSPNRRFFSCPQLPDGLAEALRGMGATITPETTYEVESVMGV